MSRRALTAATRWPWYPTLLALAWLLGSFAVVHVEPAAAIRTFLIFCAVSIVVTVVAVAILGRERGGLLATMVLVGLIVVRDPILVVPLLVAVPLLFIERRWAIQGRTHLPWPRIHEALTIVAAALVVVQLAQIVTASDPNPELASTAWDNVQVGEGPRPDIFVIVADAHGRADTLENGYGYDARPFLDGLEKQGLEVSDASRSNYYLTRFSLASLFTASYLDDLNEIPTEAFGDGYTRRTIHENPTFPLLRRAGYEITVVSSGFEHLGLRSADRYVDTGQVNEFEAAMLQAVSAAGLRQLVAPRWDITQYRERMLANLDALAAIAREPSDAPRFVFVHLPAPHWPFAFSEDCSPEGTIAFEGGGEARRGGDARTVEAVRAQTACTDRLLGAAISDLVAAQPDAVTILMSDHGPEEHLDWWSPSPEGLDERSAILFAARTPGHPRLFPEDISLVNVVPTLLNAYLGTSLPLQPTEVWFGPRPQDNRFVEVTLP